MAGAFPDADGFVNPDSVGTANPEEAPTNPVSDGFTDTGQQTQSLTGQQKNPFVKSVIFLSLLQIVVRLLMAINALSVQSLTDMCCAQLQASSWHSSVLRLSKPQLPRQYGVTMSDINGCFMSFWNACFIASFDVFWRVYRAWFCFVVS